MTALQGALATLVRRHHLVPPDTAALQHLGVRSVADREELLRLAVNLGVAIDWSEE